jgi:redox-sensing transcriptional repressor
MIINKNCILRLSRYKKSVVRLRAMGFKKVFSENLADAVGVTPSQVRKDFSQFGITGNKKGGYEIDDLVGKLNSVLGKDDEERVVLIGCGNIGSALMKYSGFKKEGINIIAAFDSDPVRISDRSTPPVFPVDMLESYISKNEIKTAIIAVPDMAAQSVFESIVRAGIRGVLNFAPIHLKSMSNVVITNVNLEMELEAVIYFVHFGGIIAEELEAE